MAEGYDIDPDDPAERPRLRRVPGRPAAGGSTSAGAPTAGTSAAATRRRRSTPAATPPTKATRSSRASSPARTGSGTTCREEDFDGPVLAPPRHHPLDQPVPGPAGRVPHDWERPAELTDDPPRPARAILTIRTPPRSSSSGGAGTSSSALVRSLTPEECLEPGYQRDPDWTVRDVVAHLGTWLAEAQVQFERMAVRDLRGSRHRHRRAQRGVPGGHGRPAVGRRLGPGQRRLGR